MHSSFVISVRWLTRRAQWFCAIGAAAWQVPAVQAGVYEWGNSTGSWSAGVFWMNLAPSGNDATDVLRFSGDVGTTAGAAPNYTATNDVVGRFLVNALEFDATDAAGLSTDPPILIDAIAGAQVVLGGDAPSLRQLNAGSITLDLPLELQAPLSLEGNGTGVVTMNLAVSGLYDITKQGTTTFRFGTPPPVPPVVGVPSENTWMGRLTINSGTVRFNNNAFSGITALRQNPVSLTAASATLTCSSELRLGSLSGPAGLVQSQVTGTNTATENIVIQAMQPGSYGGTVRLGPPTGTGGTGGALVVRGPAEQIVTGTLDINKDVAVAGRFTLAESASLGAQTTGAIVLEGGTFKLDNTVVNNNNRLRDGSGTSTGLDSTGGGQLLLVGNVAGTTETMGRVQLGSSTKGRSGRVKVFLVHSSTIAPTVLTLGSVNRDVTTVAQTATIDYSASTTTGVPLALGTVGNTPRIMITTAPLSLNGLMTNSAGTGAVGFATVNGSDFAAYGANGVTAVSTTAFPTASAPTANALLVASATVSANFGLNSLKIQPTTSVQTLTINSGRTLSVPGILLAGANDYTIAGPGVLGGTGVHYYHVQQAKLSIGATMPNQILVKSGEGLLALTGANNAVNQALVLQAGTVRAQAGSSLPSGELKFRGGVLELTGGGTFTRPLGFAAGAVNWSEFDTAAPPAAISEDRGSGGFAAVGTDLLVDLQTAGPTLIAWEDPGFVQSSFALVLGSTRADRKVTLVDNFQLNSTEATVKFSYREIRVIDNPNVTTDSAVVSGVISGAKYNDLLKSGNGTLELTAANTFEGATWVQNGTLLVTGSTTGIATEVLSGATLGGTGSTSHILLASGGTIAPGIGGIGTLSAAGCTWHGGGILRCELSASGASADRLTLGSGPLRKGAGVGPRAFDFAGTGANGLTYVLATFGRTECTAADFTATNLAPGVTGFFKINTGNTLVFITGTPPVSPLETWRQLHFGPTATDAGDAANTNDFDHDGRSNLYEYALGTDPTLPDAAGLPVGGRNGNFMTLQFPRNVTATDIALTIETSPDLHPLHWSTLAGWSDATGWTLAPNVTLTQTAGIVTFEDNGDFTDPGISRRFLRINVTAP